MTPKSKECHKEADISVLQSTYSTMAGDIKEIKESIGKIYDKINSMSDKFVTKEDHKAAHEENKSKITRLETAWIMTLVSIACYFLTMAASKIFH